MADTDPIPPQDRPPTDPTAHPALGKKRKRRKWPWVILILLLLIGLLVVFAPTIASTPPVRSFVIGQVNDHLNGKVTVEDWSLGWTSGIDVAGVRVYDEQARLVLEMERLQTDLSLIGAAQGDLALGQTTIDGLNLVQLEIDENGQTNYQKLVKADPSKPEPATKPSDADQPVELPNITGDIRINNLRGTIIDARSPQPIFIDPSDIAVTIANINEPIANDVKLVVRVGQGPPGSIALSGKADVADQGQLAIEKLSADQKLQLASLDLTAANPFLADAGVSLGGVANGELQVNASGTTDGAAQGQIAVDNLSATGDALKGDRFATPRLSIPIQVGISNADPNRTLLRIQQLGIETKEATVAVTGEFALQALQRVIEQKAPGDSGTIQLAVNVNDFASLANQLPNTLNLVEGVEIRSGTLAAMTDVQLQTDRAVVAQKIDLQATGTNNGEQIVLQPIHIDANAAVLPGAGDLPDLRDLALRLTSEFATVNGAGSSLAALSVTSEFDLGKVQQQVGQFVDFGGINMTGTGSLATNTRGDVLDADQPLAADLKLNLNNVALQGVGEEMGVAIGQLAVSGEGTYSSQTITLDAPLTVAIQQLTVDKPAAEGAQRTAVLENENINLAVAGVIQASDDQTGARLTTLQLTTASDFLKLSKSEGRELVVNLGQDGSFEGRGELALGADLKRLSDIGQSFAAAGPTTQPTAPADEIESGRLDGTIRFARAEAPTTNVDGNFTISNLTVGDYLQNEQVTIAMRAAAPDELSALTASADVNSSFATISLADCELLLKTTAGDETKAAGVWEMVQSATIAINAPDLAKLYALANTVAPPAAPAPEATADEDGSAAEEEPLPPLEVRRGTAQANIRVARDGQTTKLDVNQLNVSGLVLRRGDHRYAMGENRNINLALAAAISAADDPTGQKSIAQQISAIEVTQLEGNLAVAQVAMTQPIAIRDPGGSPSAAGAVQLTGTLDDLAPLLETVQGAEFPYRGRYTLAQSLSTQGDVVTVAGNLSATGFQVLSGEEVVFAEEQVEMANNLSADTKNKVANISNLTLNMKSSRAVNLAMKGTINDWETRRQFRDMTVNVGYDLEQLWKIVFPMLAPETQEQLKTLQVAGKDQATLTVAGRFPSTQPTNEAIELLDVQGNFPVALVDHEGIRVEDLPVAFRLRGGILRMARDVTASFNGGSLDLSRIEVDLRQETPRLTLVEDHQLVKGATINPLLGKSLGQFVNPMFANATRAQGLLSVRLEQCENLALSEAIKTPESGSMRMMFTLAEMDIANPLGGLILGQLTKIPGIGSFVQPDDVDVFRGNIRDAVVTIENGVTTQDITMEIIDPKAAQRAAEVIGSEKPAVPTYPLRFQGDVELASLQQSLSLTLPPSLLDKWGLEDLVKAFPKGLPLTLGGTTLQPKVDLVGNLTEELIKGQLQNLGGIGGDGGDDGGNPVGGLLEELLGNDDEDEEQQLRDDAPRERNRQPEADRERPRRQDPAADRDAEQRRNDRNRNRNRNRDDDNRTRDERPRDDAERNRSGGG